MIKRYLFLIANLVFVLVFLNVFKFEIDNIIIGLLVVILTELQSK